MPKRMPADILPLLMTLLVGFVFLLPFALLALEAAREAHQILDYGKQVEQTGIPVPDFINHLPYGAKPVGDWWNANLAHAGWFKEAIEKVDTSSNREIGRNFGVAAVHRVILFAFSLLTLFFLFKEGESVVRQMRLLSHKLFGARGERVGHQMIASVHGTVNGLVLVGIGEGVVLGVVYFFTHVPHPILFGAVTAVAAMIPFAAAIAFLLAALLLVGSGSVVQAVIVVVAGFLVTFTADHFVRPKLIGGATKLPFLWVLLGILGGVETFQLLGLFVGPAVMAALILLWRDYTDPEAGRQHG
jgi:predicted PurR-regulated permease PerM